MAHVSIIGTGNMGQALTGLVTKGGHTVQQVNSSSDITERLAGDVIILAVPHGSIADVVTSSRRRSAAEVTA